MQIISQFKSWAYSSDISRGKEPFPIRVMNEKNKLQLEKFIYIRRNIYLGDAPRSKGAMHCLCAPGSCNITECPCLKGGLAYSVVSVEVFFMFLAFSGNQ